MTTEQKTAEQILERNFKRFNQAVPFSWMLDSMKEYARQKCKEQREICAESASSKCLFEENKKASLDWLIDKSSILNAKEPEI